MAGAALAGGAALAQPAEKQILELRLYKVAPGEKRARLDAFLANAAIPALNRIGITPVGVFGWDDPKKGDLYVLLPHPDLAWVVVATEARSPTRSSSRRAATHSTSPRRTPCTTASKARS